MASGNGTYRVFSLILRHGFTLVCILLPALAQYPAAAGIQDDSSHTRLLTFNAQTAGIDGREWNQTYPAATTVDGVHRTVLVRFPGAAQAIKDAIEAGFTIAKAEVVLDYDGYETAPEGYSVRHGLGEKLWKGNPPQWHIVAWALRRPWMADKERGPTFNAHIRGAGYWTRYGAADIEMDRYPVRFGPSELSIASPRAHIDVSALFSDRVLGIYTGARLRSLEENGFLLRKWETYDTRYREEGNAYEWAVPTGGHGLRFRNPRLLVTCKITPALNRSIRLALPPRTDIDTFAKRLQTTGAGGNPTAFMPSRVEFSRLARQLSQNRWSTLNATQRQRVTELYKIGGDGISTWAKAIESDDYRAYERLIREVLATPPRYWQGWSVQDYLLVWYLYREMLPAYVQDHMKIYWESWLMPDRAAKDLFHPQSKEAAAYWQQTKDWRGGASFFRAGYNYEASTQNFNHMAAMGALLGGEVVGSRYAMTDGRHGLEHFPMRLWAMRDGSTQEMLDHYYFSVTLSAQKMFADFGPTELDRIMGKILVDRSIEMLATAYHPSLKRFVSASGRARLSGVLVEQDGIYGVLHTLSRRGTLNYLDRPIEARTHGMPIWGYDFPPGRVAVQTLTQKWAPDWVSHAIDDKRFPFEETSTETTRGIFHPPLWRRMYLGRHYGLASQDIKGGTADVIAQWNHKREPASSMEDLGTLTLRYAINDPDMATTQDGIMPYAGGVVTYQHKNRAIVCTKPRTERERIETLAGRGGLKSLATVIALWNFRPEAGWELYVDGSPITKLPLNVKAGQVITIKDGVTYLGIIPLPATDLGRTDEVVIGFGGGGKSEPHGAAIKPALTIISYNFKTDKAIALGGLDWPLINTATHGGFVIELGDEAEYGGFEAFASRMQSNRVITSWVPRKKALHVKYLSGDDLLEVGCSMDYAQSDVHYAVKPGEQTKAILYRKVNGQWPYLLPGIERDTSIAQQGTAGRLEKNGAVLMTERGRKAYLQAEPISGTYTGYNPLPDPTDWSLSMPGGVVVRADGKVSLLRVAVQPTANRVWVDYATKDGQSGSGMASRLLITGLGQHPYVELNGRPLASSVATVHMNGATAYAIPLGPVQPLEGNR